MSTLMKNPAPQRPQAGSGARTLSGARAAWLVAEREISTRLRSKAFLISTGLLMLIVLAGVVVGGIVAKSGGFGGDTKVAAVGVAQQALAPFEGKGFAVTSVADRAAAEQLVRDEKVDVAVLPGGNTAVDLTVLARDTPPLELLQALSVQPEVELLTSSDTNPMLAYFLAIGFGMVFMMSALTFGTTIAQSVVEEKQTRIVEILLATVTARTMLVGKVIGNSILALAQVVATVVLASVGMLATGQDLLFGELGASLVWFGVLFAFAFVFIAGLYAALASLVSRQEDIGSATSPMMMLVMLPYLAVVFFRDDATVLTVMSYVPLSAPVGMPMRLYLGTAEWWEPILSLAILVVTIAVALRLGARIYSNSILRIGTRVKFGEALKG